MGRIEGGFAARHGALIAGIAAALAALPGSGLPFLSDDWAFVARLRQDFVLRTPFAYVRPLSSAWLWLDLKLFGTSAACLHLATAAVLGLGAALLVILLRRLTGDARLAALAGLIFALHPHHIEIAAWIAARPDVLSGVLAFLAVGAHARWLQTGSGLPLVAMAFLEAALLAKESAVAVPAVALALGLVARGGRPPAGRLARGVGALGAVAILHFVVLWPSVSGRSALSVVAASRGLRSPGTLADFISGAIFGASPDIIEESPRLWLLGAIVAIGLLVTGAWRRSGGIPGVAWISGIVFLAAVPPALISFQARYLYLPSAAAAAGLAALILALGPRGRAAAIGLGCAVWSLASLDLWTSWHTAGRVSRVLVAEIASAVDHASGLYVVNVPHRVRGVPVVADFGGVTEILTGRRTPVGYAALVDYADAEAEGLAPSSGGPVLRPDDAVAIRLAVPDRFRAGLVWPYRRDLASAGSGTGTAGSAATLNLDPAAGELEVIVPSSVAPADRVRYWSAGHLHPVVR